MWQAAIVAEVTAPRNAPSAANDIEAEAAQDLVEMERAGLRVKRPCNYSASSKHWHSRRSSACPSACAHLDISGGLPARHCEQTVPANRPQGRQASRQCQAADGHSRRCDVPAVGGGAPSPGDDNAVEALALQDLLELRRSGVAEHWGHSYGPAVEAVRQREGKVGMPAHPD